MEKYIILVDSSSGYYEEEAKNFNLEFLPLLLTIKDENKTLLDNNKEIQQKEFYDVLKYKTILTSQTTPLLMTQKWDALLNKYEKIIFFPISSKLSSQYSLAKKLAEDKKYKNRVIIINSESVSDVTKEMVIRSQEFLKTHKVEELPDFVEKLKQKYCAFIIPHNLNTLMRGGRVTPSVATLSNILRIKPILEFKGDINKFSKTKSLKKAIKEILKEAYRRFKTQKGKLILVQSLCDEELKNQIIKIINNEDFTISKISMLSNVIAAHTGYNTFVLIYWID